MPVIIALAFAIVFVLIVRYIIKRIDGRAVHKERMEEIEARNWKERLKSRSSSIWSGKRSFGKFKSDR